MSFYRLIKPEWANATLANGDPNPKFIRAIPGDKTVEGYNYSAEFISEKNQLGYNIYFFPNHPSTDVYSAGVKHLSGKQIDTFNYVFVDMDLKDEIYKTKEEFLTKVAEFPLKPTMVVDSGNGIHAYWKIRDLTRDAYVITQLALINFFSTDDSVYTVLQLMRLPGYLNTKKEDEFKYAAILAEASSQEEYSLAQLPSFIYEMPEELVNKAQTHINKLDGKLKINLPEFVDLDELPDKFIEYLERPENVESYNLFRSPRETMGDRSRADMKLANRLFRDGFNRKEALAIISNTEKALSKGASRKQYAELTIDKVYAEKLNRKFLTVGQRSRTTEDLRNLGEEVKGTWYFDSSVLGHPWRKKEILGLIAGPGVGKTSVTLKWMKDAIENNTENDDIYIFFSLEMSVGEIVDRWNRLVGVNSPLADRLYVIGNEDENGDPRNIGLQEIYEDASEIKKLSGKNIGMLAIDHIGILSKHIDTRKKHKFGIQGEVDSGYGEVRTLTLNTLATQLKPLSKMLDTFIIVLTQTTKEKGVGDLPIDKDGAYGISQYENIMDRIVTIWQPLMRVQNQTKTRFLAWQYVKVRNKHKDDKLQTHEPKLLTFNLDTGDLHVSNEEEYQEFQRLLPMAAQVRENITKKKGTGYSIQLITESIHKAKIALGLVVNNGLR